MPDEETNTENATNIGGNVFTGGGDFISRDKKVIHNIVLVGRFLDFAQIESILPKSIQPEDFPNINDAINNVLKTRSNADLAEAISYAGGILEGFFNEFIPNLPYRDVPLEEMLDWLIDRIGTTLCVHHEWEIFSEFNVVWLRSTSRLWHETFADAPEFIIRLNDLNGTKFFELLNLKDAKPQPLTSKTSKFNPSRPHDNKKYTDRHFKILLAGIVFDLIQLGSKKIQIRHKRIANIKFLEELKSLVYPPDTKD